MKIIDLLNKIANGEQVISFEHNKELYIWDEKSKWYLSEPLLNYFSLSFDNLNDEITNIKEDIDIPLIPDDELFIINDKLLDYNFRVVEEKINQVVKEFNEYRREHNE